MKKAIFAGSYDPLTNGHLDILRQAHELFDEIHLVYANNPEKKRTFDINIMVEATKKALEELGLTKVVVYHYTGYISDLARDNDIHHLIRGLRNPNDYTYEEDVAKKNLELNPELRTIYFRANNEIISSSFVKDLFKHGKDVSKYVNHNILDAMKG